MPKSKFNRCPILQADWVNNLLILLAILSVKTSKPLSDLENIQLREGILTLLEGHKSIKDLLITSSFWSHPCPPNPLFFFLIYFFPSLLLFSHHILQACLWCFCCLRFHRQEIQECWDTEVCVKRHCFPPLCQLHMCLYKVTEYCHRSVLFSLLKKTHTINRNT